MFVLWQKKQMTITDLVKETSLVKSTLTTMLERLEKVDLIKKITDEKDRRKTQVTLTEKSKKMEKKYISISEEMDSIYYKDFKKEEMVLFEQYLKRILSNLQNYEENINESGQR